MQKRARVALSVLIFLTLCLQGSAQPPAEQGLVGVYAWNMADPLFGGFSGLELSEDGSSLIALSDRGNYLQARIKRDGAGRIEAIQGGTITAIKGPDGKPIQSKKRDSDSEGLAIGPDGSVYISYEGRARVMRHDRLGAAGHDLPILPAFKKLPLNASFESVAVDAKGRVYVIPEEVKENKPVRLLTGQQGNPSGPDFPIWRFDGTGWSQPYSLPRLGPHLPADADIGPDGRLYVLEREFRGLGGFGSRVRSFRLGKTALEDMRIEMQSVPGRYDNLEGLSVWRDAQGDIRLSMISDDNFLFLQRTEVVEYRVMPPKTQ